MNKQTKKIITILLSIFLIFGISFGALAAIYVYQGGTGLSSATKGYVLTGYDAYFLQATSSIFIDTNGYIGIGTTTPEMLLSVGTTSGSQFLVNSAGAIMAVTLDTGQGAYELFAMNQDVESTDAVTFLTVDTGQGANELYDMNQNVLTTSNPTFNGLTITTGVTGVTSTWSGLITANGGILSTASSTFSEDFTAGGTTQLFVDADGYIGIASSTPSHTFSVQGQGFFTGTTTINNIVIPQVYDAMTEPSGFVNKTATLSFTNGTRTFTITGDHDIYISGVRYSKTTDSKVISDDTGTHWIYYGADGSIKDSTTVPSFFLPLIATVYWNTDIDQGVLGEERHGIKMDADTHSLLHYTVGTRYESGLTGTFDDTNGTTTAGVINDEDLDHIISEQTQFRVFYKNGSENFEWTDAQDAYYQTFGGTLLYNDSNATSTVTVNQYVAYWIFATNDSDTPITSLMGQRVDTILANARANNKYESLTLGSLPFEEMKLLYRVIVRNLAGSPSYIESQDLRAVSNLPAGTYVATQHNVLTGLEWGIAGHNDSNLSINPAGSGYVGIGTSTPSYLLTVGTTVGDNFIVNSSGDATSTQFYATTFGINSEYFTDLTGTGLQNSTGVLTLNATGDWTGTLDGYEAADLVFSTTTNDYWASQSNVSLFINDAGYITASTWATTSADYWGSQRAGDHISWDTNFDVDDDFVLNTTDTMTGLTVTYSTTTGTLAIPTSATLSLSQSAQFGYDTTTGQLRIHDGTADRVLATGLKAFTIGPVEKPVASDQIPNHFKAPFGMTITQVDCLLDPADTTGIEIDIDIFEADGNGDSTTTVFNIPLTVKNTNTATTTFANAVIDSGDWVGSFYSNASGTASWISCTVKYRITAD